MLGLFKRTKVESWETDLLLNVIHKLPIDYSERFVNQIKEGLFRRVLIGYSDIEGYVGFSYNSKVYDRFYDKNARNFKFENIKVFDVKSNNYLKLSIYFYSGVINGYSVEGSKKYKLDITKINISEFQKKYLETNDYDLISAILTPREKELISPSEVYLVELNNKNYYHLKDLEDGDFLALDLDKNIYSITHDPFEIRVLKEELEDIWCL